MMVEKDELRVRNAGQATESIQEKGIKAAQGIENPLAHAALTIPVNQADANTVRHYSVFTGLEKRAIILFGGGR